MSVCSATSSAKTVRGIDKLVDDYDLSSERKYPSVKDYYVASSSPKKPIQLQTGLTNYSGLQLGRLDNASVLDLNYCLYL